MKNIYLGIAMILMHTVSFSQVEGTWKLANQNGAMGVGPNKGDISWWSTTLDDLIGRYCHFDDSITFDANGDMFHYMDGNTWLEEWQSGIGDDCGAPVYPHNGSVAATWTYDAAAATLTVNGLGAHMGLAKVINGAEINDPANAATSITYEVTFANGNNIMILDINFGVGYWRFFYQRTDALNVASPNVTFRVDMSEYAGTIANGVFLSGSFNAWCASCAPMNAIGNGVYELEVELPVSSIQYKFQVDEWMDQEFLDPAASCVDPIADGFDNRIYEVTGDAVLPAVCFGSCEVCESASLSEHAQSNLSVYPNPASDQITVQSDELIFSVELYDLTGKQVRNLLPNSNETSVSLEGLENGVYTLKVNSEKGTSVKKIIRY